MRTITLSILLFGILIFVSGCDGDNGNGGGDANGGMAVTTLCDSLGDSQDSDFIDCNVTVSALNSIAPGTVQQRGPVETPGTGKINIPFLGDRDNRNFINTAVDFNGDGVIAPYDSGSGLQVEWIVQNHPAIISPLDYNFYFDIRDSQVDTGIPYNLTIILSDEPITTADTFTGDMPDNVSFIEGAVELTVFNFENFVDPDPDTIGSGGGSFEGAISGGASSRDTEIMTVDGVDIVTLTGVPDLPQSINTCVPNSIANSLAWLAETFNFDLMIDEGDGTILPVDLNDIESIGNNLLNPLLNFFGDEGGLLTRNGMVVGVLPQNIVPIKNKFVEMNNIPVKTMEVNIDPMNPGALVEELKDRLEEGCIAELKLDMFNAQGQKIGGHMVNLSGYSLGADFKTDDFGDPIPGDTTGTKKLVFIDANHTVTDSQTGMIVPQNDVYDYNISGEDILIQNYMYGPNGTSTVKLVGAIIQCVDLGSDETDFSMMVTSDDLSIVHKVFESPCPQKIGSITITNDGTVAFDWFRLGLAGTRTTPSAGRLEPGESVMLMVEFTCQVPDDINGNIRIKAVVGDTEQEVSVPVSVDVQH